MNMKVVQTKYVKNTSVSEERRTAEDFIEMVGGLFEEPVSFILDNINIEGTKDGIQVNTTFKVVQDAWEEEEFLYELNAREAFRKIPGVFKKYIKEWSRMPDHYCLLA